MPHRSDQKNQIDDYNSVIVQQERAYVNQLIGVFGRLYPGDVEILQAPNGNKRSFFSKTKRLLYASGIGGGFQPGIPEAAKCGASSPTTPLACQGLITSGK